MDTERDWRDWFFLGMGTILWALYTGVGYLLGGDMMLVMSGIGTLAGMIGMVGWKRGG